MSSEGDDEPLVLAAGLLPGQSHVQHPIAAMAVNSDLLVQRALSRLGCLLDQGFELGQRRARIRVDEFLRRHRKHSLRRGIGDRHTPLAINTDDTCGNARQHGLGETPASIDQIARGSETVVLATQLRGHLVEGLAQCGEIPLLLADRDLNVEISRCHLTRRIDQAPYRHDEGVRIGSTRTTPRTAG